VANNKKNRDAAAPAPVPVSRLQRSLMYMAGSILGLGVIAIIALLIGEATLKPANFDGSPIWVTVAFLPELAIPLGFLLFIALIIVTYVQRSRAAKGADQ
jgi:membrane protein implicated in regulation of membrane protease activity